VKPESRDYLLMHPQVHPTARVLFKKVLAELRESGLPATVVEVYRDPRRQRLLFAQGRTDATLKALGYTAEEIAEARRLGYTADKRIVTRIKEGGMHSQGRAMDVAFVVNDRISFDVPDAWWQRYGAVARKYGLVWGGDWKTLKDRPHVEYRGE
jgi:D-alanyl-D-alanine dipeptidase